MTGPTLQTIACIYDACGRPDDGRFEVSENNAATERRSAVAHLSRFPPESGRICSMMRGDMALDPATYFAGAVGLLRLACFLVLALLLNGCARTDRIPTQRRILLLKQSPEPSSSKRPCARDQPLRLRADARRVYSPAATYKRAAEQDFGNLGLASAGVDRVEGTQQQDKPAGTPYRLVKRARKSTSQHKRMKAPEHEQRPVQGLQSAKFEGQADGKKPDVRSRKIEAKRAIAVGQQEPVDAAVLDQRRQGRKGLQIKVVVACNRVLGIPSQDPRMARCRPDRPCERRRQPGILEGVEVPLKRVRLTGASSRSFCLEHRKRGTAITFVAAQPLPGKDRPLGLQQLPVSPRIGPIRNIEGAARHVAVGPSTGARSGGPTRNLLKAAELAQHARENMRWPRLRPFPQ